jgi:hypothetical protein
MTDSLWSVSTLDEILAHAARKPVLDPPFESPLEENFARSILKYVDDAVTLGKQMEVNTLCGRFRLDFVAIRSGRAIGLECDGAEFHPSTLRDEWRDAMILGDASITSIYRFRGKDVFSSVEDCLFILSAWEPQLFSDRGHRRLASEASEEAKAVINQHHLDDEWRIFVPYKKYNHQYGTVVERHSKMPFTRGSHLLVEHYSFAKKHGGGDLERLIRLANP